VTADDTGVGTGNENLELSNIVKTPLNWHSLQIAFPLDVGTNAQMRWMCNLLQATVRYLMEL